MRIKQLMESMGEERDVCAAIIYSRDVALQRGLSDDEVKDFERIGRRLENKEIAMPADRAELASNL